MLTDEKHAVLTQVELDALPEYSFSLPTGTVPGKQWKRKVASDWWLGEYGKIDEATDTITIRWRKILTVEANIREQL